MVVNAQGNASQQALEAIGKHAGGGHIHADDSVPGLGLFFAQTLVEPAEPIGNLGIFQNMGGFSQLPQPPAKSRGAAQGVPVGTAVGHDGVAVVLCQKGGGFRSRQFLHRALPPES